MRALILLALVIPMTFNGCGTTEQTKLAPITDPRMAWCRLEKPRTATAEEFLAWSEKQKQDFVAHNERGELWCKWKPMT